MRSVGVRCARGDSDAETVERRAESGYSLQVLLTLTILYDPPVASSAISAGGASSPMPAPCRWVWRSSGGWREGWHDRLTERQALVGMVVALAFWA